jgi:NAD-dependent oxidoreductase involved in siderophore biosynthesis
MGFVEGLCSRLVLLHCLELLCLVIEFEFRCIRVGFVSLLLCLRNLLAWFCCTTLYLVYQ